MKVWLKTPWARSRVEHLLVDGGAGQRGKPGLADAGGDRLGR